jgi:hypothetical protein
MTPRLSSVSTFETIFLCCIANPLLTYKYDFINILISLAEISIRVASIYVINCAKMPPRVLINCKVRFVDLDKLNFLMMVWF